ncbi:hypothetical protein F5884DRAFT_18368 [Xylogone sp. PMI_703]|nr:hypothetical protein F5884DRAFT_18368 [Xylogone sp. PMI_703]
MTMPRNKRAVRGGRSRAPRGGSIGGSGMNSRLDSDVFVPFGGSPKHKHNGYTLQEEARNTERNHSFWDSDQKLRHSKINFVTGGRLYNEEPSSTESALAQMSLDSPPEEDAVELGFNSKTDGAGDSIFFMDANGAEPPDTGLPLPHVHSPSPTPSNSSEEVILFTGRDKNKARADNSKSPAPSLNPIDAKIKVIEDKIHEKEEQLHNILVQNERGHSNSPSDPLHLPPLETTFPTTGQKGTQRSRQGRGRKARKREEDDALVTDYLANIDSDDYHMQSFASRDLGGSDGDIWQDGSEEVEVELAPFQQRQLLDGWEKEDIMDFDNMSTSDDIPEDIQAILSKRVRETGVQYLVVGEDQTADDARWILASSLTSAQAKLQISKFEAEEKLVAELYENHSDSENSSYSESVNSADDDMADARPLQEGKNRMSDEQIARLLAKQEELGMGSSELQLFDDDFGLGREEDGYQDEDGDAYSPVPQRRPTARATVVRPAQARTRGGRPAPDIFPRATMLADAYDGFDVMDFDRPSLRKKNKGKRGRLNLDLSDSELETSMQLAFANDRIKKKERKQEREELRAKGLLGNKGGKPDLKQKYKEGMGMSAIKEEIRDFLKSGNTTLALPPMDKADRKVVHEIANAFRLKSKSAGQGSNRFPVLYRSLRTAPYEEDVFDAIEARISRRFLPRMDLKYRNSSTMPKRSGGGSGYNAAVKYRDGDIVGGSAPEIGIENKGRAMLEKMGWSTGTALGALNNKGILEPVSHVVKTSKAGLG